MPTFSEMFPSYARLFSSIGRLVSKGRSRERFAPPQQVAMAPSYANRQADDYTGQDPDAQPQPQDPQDATEQLDPRLDGQPDEDGNGQRSDPAALPGADQTTGDTPGGFASTEVSQTTSPQETSALADPRSAAPVLSPQDSEILRLYQAWVGLESGIAQAQDNLSQILATRGKAVVLRREAQKILEQGDALREESQRIGDAAWRAFDRGFATNIRGFANRRAMVREIDLSRRTQAELHRNVHRKAWENVEQSREDATTELIKLLDSLESVAGLVQRELDEATTLPGLARSLRDSAEEELRCAEAVKDELLLLGTEALNQLGVTPTSETAYGLETDLTPGPTGLPGGVGLPGPSASPAPGSVDIVEVGDQDRSVPGSLSWEAVGETPGDTLGLAPDVTRSPEASAPAPAPEPPQEPAVQPDILPAARTVEDPTVIEPQPAAAADLLREMEAARASVEAAYSVPPPLVQPVVQPEVPVQPPEAPGPLRQR